jgi:succinyl-diaminopimelate desuccinylase
MSDVFHLWTKLRIPSVYYGPGLLSRCHVVDEWIEITDIVRAARIYALVAREAVAPHLSVESVLEAVDEARVVDLARALVRYKSENPPGDEHAITAFLKARLEGLGLTVQQIDSPSGRPNLIAEHRGTQDGPTLLFNGHTDVVPAGPGWSFEPYGGDVSDGKLLGRGAADMKGGLAATIEVAHVFEKLAPEMTGRLLWSVVSDEEAGGTHGTGFLCEQGHLKADMAIVAEPSEFRLSVSENSLLWLHFETRGKQEHTINRHQAVNAVEGMLRVADEMLSLRDEVAGLHHPNLGTPILTINQFQGGLKTNIVPDFCTMDVDFRFPAGLGLDIASAKDRIDARLQRLRDSDATLGIRYVADGKDGFEQPEDTAIVGLIQRAHQTVVGSPAAWWRRGS